MEVLLGAFKQEKALVGAFSVIVKLKSLLRFVSRCIRYIIQDEVCGVRLLQVCEHVLLPVV